MGPSWLWRNIGAAWRHSARRRDFARQLALRYATALPQSLRGRRWAIDFCHPQPIGRIRLLLRDNDGSDLFIYSEVFEHECYRLPIERPPATILDLGANIGLSTVYFARQFPDARLACVEPVPGNLRILDQNLELNGIQAQVFRAAADITDGNVMMERHAKDYGHKVAAGSQSSTPSQFEVPAISIPSLLERLGWDRIGLMKLDIEGHETVLLTTAFEWLDRVDTLCVEYHENGGEDELMRIASRFGFLPPRRLPSALWLLTRAASVEGSGA